MASLNYGNIGIILNQDLCSLKPTPHYFMRKISAFVLTLLVGLSAFAQTGMIRGKIVDKDQRAGIVPNGKGKIEKSLNSMD